MMISPMRNRQKIAVIGAGSWGTAIAGFLSGKGHETCFGGIVPIPFKNSYATVRIKNTSWPEV